jgi:hypothetical protein
MLGALLLHLATGCGAPDVPAAKPKEAPTPSPSNALNSMPMMSPKDARLSLVGDPFLSPATELATLKVPTINLLGFEKQSADYAQVVRCDANTTLKTSLGEDVETIMKGTKPEEKLKWIWFNQVFSRTDKCKVLGGSETQIVRERFQDLTAPTGEYFYVINPCILALRSTEKETCSYRLVITAPIKHTNSLTAQFVETSNQLAVAESYLGGLYSQLYYDIQAIRLQKDGCENNYTVRQNQQNFWKGIVGLSLGGIGATIGGIMSGGTAALTGFRTGINLATGLFLKIPPVPNICPEADRLITHAQKVSGELNGAVDNAINLRVKLSQIDKTYGELDQSILKGGE